MSFSRSTVVIARPSFIAALSLEFEDHATAPEIDACFLRLEEGLRKRIPELVTLFIKPQTPATWQARRAALED